MAESAEGTELAGVVLKPAFSLTVAKRLISHMPGASRDGKELAVFRVPSPLSFLIGMFTLPSPAERRWFFSRFLSRLPQGYVWGSGNGNKRCCSPTTPPSQSELEKLGLLATAERSCFCRLG